MSQITLAHLCATVMADGIQSANIVGYGSAQPTAVGNKAIGAFFIDVDGTPSSGKLTNLKVGGYSYPTDYDDDDAFVGQITAQKLNEGGGTVKDESGNAIIWSWGDWYEDDGATHICGWQDGDGNFIGTDVEDVTVELGEGLWISFDDVKWTIQSSGQVYMQTLPCQLVVGNRLCANPCPKQINLSDCIVGGYSYPTDYDDDDAFVGQLTAQKLNEGGGTVKDDNGNAIIWSWGDWYEDDGATHICGWQDGDGNFIGTDVDDVTLEMGEALWVSSDDTKWQVVFPKP